VQRLEQVRLARSVRTRDEDEARLELEVELSVRAEVPEREVLNDQPAGDQPASLIERGLNQRA
jgi:hypothetical protein